MIISVPFLLMTRLYSALASLSSICRSTVSLLLCSICISLSHAKDMVLVLSWREGLCEYQVGVAVVCDHAVLVSTAVMDGKETCVISVQFTDGCDLYE